LEAEMGPLGGLWPESELGPVESEGFLTKQLVTCIGNKRSLLDFIGTGLDEVSTRLGKDRLDILDAFSGSGVVSRFFKRRSRRLVANDIEPYAEAANACYLANASELDRTRLVEEHEWLLERIRSDPQPGFIAELYAPKDDARIQSGERVFYTRGNAEYLDSARQHIERLDARDRVFFIAPLLSEASIHANTAGVFKGFYKDKESGIGKFGGKKGDALSRIKGGICLPFPVFSRFECEVEVRRQDARIAARESGELDLAYLDPPYNQHPYGSNYFMLNLVTSYRRPEQVSKVSGIPVDWRRSAYNKAREALSALRELAESVDAAFLLVSFNSEGFIQETEMREMLGKLGDVRVLERRYNAFRGSRNLSGRDLHVAEYLFIVEKR